MNKSAGSGRLLSGPPFAMVLMVVLIPTAARGVDVNEDGDLDAVFANPSQKNRVCLGDGDGSFFCGNAGSNTAATRGVALGDIDDDGHLDAVFANSGQLNRVCLGDGNGFFFCPQLSADTNKTRGVALGDIDGDGDLDAVFANFGRNRVCLGDGNGLFACNDVIPETDNSSGVALAVDGVERLAGPDRFATAAAISESEFSPLVPVAYIAVGSNFPDALAGGPVAALNKGPILLVTTDTIPAATATELTRLRPKTIVILGGTGVVSPAVETQLASFTF